jgi:hypothetical protein
MKSSNSRALSFARPRLQWLEDRLQPSVFLPHAVPLQPAAGFSQSPLTGVGAVVNTLGGDRTQGSPTPGLPCLSRQHERRGQRHRGRAGGTTAYVAGSLLNGRSTDEQFGKLDITTGITPVRFWLAEYGPGYDFVLNGAAVNPTPPGEAYFAGTLFYNRFYPGYSSPQALNADFSNTTNPFVDFYYPNDFTSSVAAVAVGPSGSVYLAGTSRDPMTMQTTIQLTKLDGALNPVGTPVLVGSPTGTGSGSGAAIAIAVDETGEHVIGVGTTSSPDLSTDGTTLNNPTSDAVLFRYTFM